MFRIPAIELIESNMKESDKARSQPYSGRTGSSRRVDLLQEANIRTHLIPGANTMKP